MFMPKPKKKRGPGRPRGGVVGDAVISLRVQQSLRDELERIATREGRPLANLVRFILEQDVKRRRAKE